MAEVRLSEGVALQSALRRFHCEGQQEDVMQEVQRHSFFLTSGEVKRSKKHSYPNVAGKKLVRSKADNRWVAP